MTPPVQTLWLGPQLSALQELSIRSFLAHGHEYRLYTYDAIANVPPGVVVLDAASILPRDEIFTYQRGFGRGSVSAFSNVFRYTLLLHHGGWWVDADVVCLQPFGEDADHVIATERDAAGQVQAATCVLRAPVGSEALAWCLEECRRRDRATLEWGEIGPRLMQQAVDRFGLAQYCVPPHVFNPVDYSAFTDLLAPDFDSARLQQSSAVHLWHQKWVSHCLDVDYTGPASSLYAQLWRRYVPSVDAREDAFARLERHAEYLRQTVATLLRERDEATWALEKATRTAAETEAERPRLQMELDRLEGERSLLAARLTAVQTQLGHTEAQLSRALSDLARARGESEALRRSLSWRVTAPLRWVYDRLVGVRRPRDR